jgi:UPF0755 protein
MKFLHYLVKKKFTREQWFFIFSIFLLIFVICYYFYFKKPQGFVPETVVTVSSGESLTTIAKNLKEQNVITSSFWFINLVIFRHGETSVTAGDYIFHEPENIVSVARRFTTADFQLTPIKVTIPEGSSTYDIADIVSKKFAGFDTVKFLELSRSKEGYLFPDTYFLFATVKPDALITILEDNFKTKITPLLPKIEASGRSLHDVLVLASLLEEEAMTTRDREIVAGIFLKRLSIGMLLQSDAPFKYINGKTSAELTQTDLKIDSPYNTYRYPGLPPTPVSNPGLDSINAALNPASTKYFYFLSDSEGKIHYAATLAEHNKNVRKYLR